MSGLGIPPDWNTHSIIPVASSLPLLRCLLMPPLRSPPGAPPIIPVSQTWISVFNGASLPILLFTISPFSGSNVWGLGLYFLVPCWPLVSRVVPGTCCCPNKYLCKEWMESWATVTITVKWERELKTHFSLEGLLDYVPGPAQGKAGGISTQETLGHTEALALSRAGRLAWIKGVQLKIPSWTHSPFVFCVWNLYGLSNGSPRRATAVRAGLVYTHRSGLLWDLAGAKPASRTLQANNC